MSPSSSSFDLWLAQAMGIRGTLRREVLDRILIWNEGQLQP